MTAVDIPAVPQESRMKTCRFWGARCSDHDTGVRRIVAVNGGTLGDPVKVAGHVGPTCHSWIDP